MLYCGCRGTLLSGIILLATGCDRSTELPAPRTMILETKPMRIDQIYPSMQGPFEILDVDFSQLDWVTSIRTEVIDADANEMMGGEFFCHSQRSCAEPDRKPPV